MMTMQDWVGEQRRLLAKFEEWWQENNKISSVQFPVSLDPGDWCEQFTSFCDRRKEATLQSTATPTPLL
jgi:hypothetical protein